MVTKHFMGVIGILIAALLVTAGPVAAETLLDDDFEYGGVAGTLVGVSGGNWTVHSGTANPVGYQTTSLSLPGYAYSGNGGAATIANYGTASAEDVNRLFTEQTGDMYAAALVNISVGNATGAYFFHFKDTTTGFRSKVYAADVGGALRFAVTGSSNTPTYPAVDFAYNTTYLVVARFNVTDLTAKLWVLTTVPATEPATPHQSDTTSTATNAMSAIAIRQADGGPVAVIDGIRVGTTWADTVVGVTLPDLSVDDVSAYEGNSGTTTFSFAVNLSAAAPAGGVTFDIATADNTATTADNDYVGQTLASQSIPEGSTSYTFDVTVNGDTAIEPDEIFYVNVTDVVGATVVDGQGQGTILNDDAAAPTLFIGDVSVLEGNSGTGNADFTVTLSGSPAGTVTVDWATVAGTATAGVDYTTSGGTLTFLVGETSKTASVPVVGDLLDELDETFSVVLSSATGGAVISDDTGLGTILDDDPMPNLTATSSVEVIEGMTAVVWLSLDAPSGLDAAVDYQTVNGTATAGSDYQAASGVASLLAGTTSGRILVTTLRDSAVEGGEAFTVDLSNPVNNVLQTGTVTVSVCDDDSGACIFGDGFETGDTSAWASTLP